jgi:hypothetical protein
MAVAVAAAELAAALAKLATTWKEMKASGRSSLQLRQNYWFQISLY